MGASPLVGPVDQTQMLQALDDRVKILEQTAIIPVGLVAYCAGAVPNGWLAIDGSALNASRYGQLSNYLGGAANLPDASGRVLVGRNAATFATLLGTGGVETVLLTAAQSGLPAHTHTASGATAATVVNNTGSGGDLGAAGAYNQSSTAVTVTVNAVVAVGASAAHSNLQPYLVLIPIIKF